MYSLTQQIADVYQVDDSISGFYTKIKMLWDEFDAAHPLPICSRTNCTCSITQKMLKMQEDQRLIVFLMKLNPTYNNVRSSLSMQQPLPSISHAYRLLVQEEKHQNVADSHTTNHSSGQQKKIH